MRQTFYFGDQVRWSFGWESPNDAGIFFACLLPILWGVHWFLATKGRGPLWKILFLGLECAVWFCLIKTLSRGALVATAAGGGLMAVYWFIEMWWSSHKLRLPFSLITSVTLRIVVVGGLMWFSGFSGRVAPDYVKEDRSVLNRAKIWQHGLSMAASSPLEGWGEGSSGRIYMQWWQPIDDTARYRTLVNSYLTLAVERGLPFLAGILGLAILIFLAAFDKEGIRTSRVNQCVRTGAAGVLGTFASGNIFTVFYDHWSLWILPALAILTISGNSFYFLHSIRIWTVRFAWAAGTAMFVSITIYLAGHLQQTKETCSIRPLTNHFIRAESRNSPDNARRILILPDPRVFGTLHGKAIRQLIGHDDAELIVAEPDIKFNELKPHLQHVDEIWAAGTQWRKLIPITNPILPRLILIHPLEYPDETNLSAINILNNRCCGVVLPEYVYDFSTIWWHEWAEVNDIRLWTSPHAALDIRPAWPSVVINQKSY